MKNKCSVDAFNLNIYCLRLLAPSISPFLCEVFNSCLNFGLFPDCLKIAKVLPIFKEGDESNPSNYRPISLLTVVGKIFEKIIFNRIIDFLNKEKVLNQNQFGLRGHVLNVLKSYLSRRFQYTEIGSKKSSMRSIKIGVPQGSIMGPLLFIIYINDLTLETSDIKSILYADDTVVFTKSEPKTNETKINVIFQKTASWLKRNRLTLNFEKTKCVDFLKKLQKTSERVYTNSKTIQNVEILSI